MSNNHHYAPNQIDEQVGRARAALSIEGATEEDIIRSFVKSGIPESDAFLCVTAARLSIKYQDILEGK
jgi:hypothetical protein